MQVPYMRRRLRGRETRGDLRDARKRAAQPDEVAFDEAQDTETVPRRQSQPVSNVGMEMCHDLRLRFPRDADPRRGAGPELAGQALKTAVPASTERRKYAGGKIGDRSGRRRPVKREIDQRQRDLAKVVPRTRAYRRETQIAERTQPRARPRRNEAPRREERHET